MRVAVVNDMHAMGGAVGPMAHRFAQALQSAGHDATLITGETTDPLPSDVPVISWPYPDKRSGLLGQLGFFRQLRDRSKAAFQKWMSTGPTDAWMALVPPSAFGSLLGGGNKIPLLYVCNSPWSLEWEVEFQASRGRAPGLFDRWMKQGPRNKVEKRVVRSAKAFVSLSTTQISWMRKQHPECVLTPSFAIPAAVVASDFQPLAISQRNQVKADFGFNPDIPLISCSRRLVPRTGVDLLIKALSGSWSKPLSVVITGGGQSRNDLEALAKGASDRVDIRFTGILELDKLRKLTAAADFSLMPTRALEGFGLSAAESFAAGTPCIATPVDALVNVVGGLDKRLLAREASPDAITAKLTECLDTQEFFSEVFRSKCSQYARETFDWDKLKGEYVSLLEAVPKGDYGALAARRVAMES